MNRRMLKRRPFGICIAARDGAMGLAMHSSANLLLHGSASSQHRPRHRRRNSGVRRRPHGHTPHRARDSGRTGGVDGHSGRSWLHAGRVDHAAGPRPHALHARGPGGRLGRQGHPVAPPAGRRGGLRAPHRAGPLPATVQLPGETVPGGVALPVPAGTMVHDLGQGGHSRPVRAAGRGHGGDGPRRGRPGGGGGQVVAGGGGSGIGRQHGTPVGLFREGVERAPARCGGHGPHAL